MHTAAAVLYPNALATSITLPMEILQAASQMASTGARGTPQVRFLLAGPNRKMVKLGSGISLKPDITLDKLPPLDLLLLPAIWRNPVPTINGARPWLDLLPELAQSPAHDKRRQAVAGAVTRAGRLGDAYLQRGNRQLPAG